jgi:hypothetical protein
MTYRVVHQSDRQKLGHHVLPPERFGEHSDVQPRAQVETRDIWKMRGTIGDMRYRVTQSPERLGDSCLDHSDFDQRAPGRQAEHLVDYERLARLGAVLSR